MKGIITVVVVGVAGAAGVYLWRKAHTVTETRDVTDDPVYQELFGTVFKETEE